MLRSEKGIHVVGAGLVGSLLAIFLARRGFQVELYERRPDLRRDDPAHGGVRGDSRTQVGANQGALTFSIFSKIPTITIEMAVLTNPRDARFIKSEEGQEKTAQAIAAGILLYRTP